MADTTFVDNVISTANRIVSAWLNVVNNFVYRGSRPTYATTTGAVNTYLLTLPSSLFTSAGLTAGDTFIFKAHQANTTAATFSVAGSTTTPPAAFQIAGNALVGGEILQNGVYSSTWTGVAWQIQNMLILPLAVLQGGTGLTSSGANGSILLGTGAAAYTNFAVGTDGYSLISLSGATNKVAYFSPGYTFSLDNGYLDWSVAASALTVAIKTLAGTDPSATDPVYVWIRSVTSATGLPTRLKITTATSVVVSSGSTLGTRNSVPFRVWIILFNDAGTLRLGVINCITSVAGAAVGNDITAQYPLKAWNVASSTAEGGVGGADLSQTIYTGSAVSAKPYVTIGYGSWETGLATAGTWSAGPTRDQPYISGTPLPGDVLQMQRNDTGAMATGGTVTPYDDTIPQIVEGNEFMNQAITPSSASNLLRVRHLGFYANAGNENTTLALHQDATSNAIAALNTTLAAAASEPTPIEVLLLAAGVAPTTFRARVGGTASTITFNGTGGARRYGGVARSFMEIEEIMG